MKKLALLLALLIACLNFAACERKCQCVTVPTPDQDYIHNCDEPIDTSSLPEISDNERSDVTDDDGVTYGYINYTLSSYGFSPVDDNLGDKIYMFKSHEELLSYYKEQSVAVTDAYEAEFFDEKSVLFIPMIRGSGSIELNVKHIYVDGNTLTVTISEFHPFGQTCDMQYKLFTVEIDKTYLTNVTEARLIYERQYESEKLTSEEYPAGTEAEYTVFDVGGSIKASGQSGVYYNRLEMIRNTYEFDELLERYAPDIGKDSLYTFAENNNNDEYFKDKMFVVMPYHIEFEGTKFGFDKLIYNDTYTYFCLHHNNSEIIGFKENTGIMIIEFRKDIVSENLEFILDFEYTAYRPNNGKRSIDFTAKYFTGCYEYDHYHGNSANRNHNYSVAVYNTERVEWLKNGLCDCGVDNTEFVAYLDSLDGEFFKDKAILVTFVKTDPGEKINIAKVRHDNEGYRKILTIVDLDDSVTPSSDDNLECRIAVAVIDKTELLGYPGIACRID